MMLNDVTEVAGSVLPLAEFRDHLRLGTGFADLGAEDAALEAYLRAAIAAIEGRTAKVLIARNFTLVLELWRDPRSQTLPVAPVRAVSALRLVDRDGGAEDIDPVRWRLVQDMSRPRIEARGGYLPAIATGGTAEIAFTAGFGPDWTDLPVDLAQAVMLLAAQYFETRSELAARGDALPFGVMALIERWRTVRVLGGRG